MNNLLNSTVHLEYMAYDRDDGCYDNEQNSVNSDDQMFYDNCYYGINDWSEIPEPVYILFINIYIEKTKNRSRCFYFD
jgi:hypothetical protein